jgi:GNAT superfamily N-acetyltransferase
MPIQVILADPQGPDALGLLRQAAIEARRLYPELQGSRDTWPVNDPTPPRGAYFVAYLDGVAVAMGAHRPWDSTSSEVRRMYTCASARRLDAARAILIAVEQDALWQGFLELKLETGFRQGPAMAMYKALGYRRIEPFGVYRQDPTSVCFAKQLASSAA